MSYFAHIYGVDQFEWYPSIDFLHLCIRKIWFFYQLYYIYNAIHLSLFEIYISLEMRIIKCIFVFILLNVLHVVFVYILGSAYILSILF
jgi:hypothetical protein